MDESRIGKQSFSEGVHERVPIHASSGWMRAAGGRVIWSLIFVLLVLANASVLAQGAVPGAGGESLLDEVSVERVVDELQPFVEEAVRSGGADLEQVHAHWVFAFSTGHFPGEPIRAQAARETALQLLRRLAIPGDMVSAYAFEMGLWPHAGASGNPIVLPPDSESAFDVVTSAFPLTAQAGTVGGHDTERAIVEIASSVDDSSGPIVVMFTNRAASISTNPVERPLMGDDAPAYVETLGRWHRAPPVNRSGASYEATYDVTRGTGERVTNTLDVVVLTPRSFTAAATRAPRSELGYQFLAVQPVEPVAAATGRGSSALLLIALLVVIAVAVVILVRSGRLPLGGSVKMVSVQGVTFSLADVREGSVICRVVSKAFREDSDADHGPTVVLDSVPYGEELLGRIVWSRGSLTWRDGEFKAIRWLDQSVRSPVRLGTRSGALDIEGEVRERQGMPPRTIRTSIDIEAGAST